MDVAIRVGGGGGRIWGDHISSPFSVPSLKFHALIIVLVHIPYYSYVLTCIRGVGGSGLGVTDSMTFTNYLHFAN